MSFENIADFWEAKTIAYGVNGNIDVDILLDDSETTCIDTTELHITRDFVIKFSTTAYYRQMTPGLTILVCIVA